MIVVIGRAVDPAASHGLVRAITVTKYDVPGATDLAIG